MADSKEASKDSAVQLAKTHLALQLLNNASVRTGATWEVAPVRVIEDKYEYTWAGKTQQGSNIYCVLVSPTDTRQYCTGQFKKTKSNESKYQAVYSQLNKGGRFIMSKVVFQQNVKEKYISTPIKLVVDLSKTKFDAIFGSSSIAVHPSPTATVAGSSDLGGDQFFDLTGMVVEVGDVRRHEKNRSSFRILIIDGSLDNDAQKVKAIPLTLFCDTDPVSAESCSDKMSVNAEGQKAFLQEQLDKNKAVSFFCISGSQDDEGKFSFRTTKNTIVIQAEGAKAEKLNSDAALHNIKAADTVAFELRSVGGGARDWSLEEGTLTRCALLRTFAQNSTGVEDLDGGETVWQLNCVQIAEPSVGQSIRSNDGSRLWLLLNIRDDSGAISLYITEAAVLKLTNAVDAAEFEQLHSEGRLRFPFWCSVKIWRKPSKTSAVQPDSAPSCHSQLEEAYLQSSGEFDSFIVDAGEQDMNQGMSIHANALLPMLGDCSEAVLPGRLDMIRKSDHYAQAVEYLTQQVPPELIKACSKVEANRPMLRPCSNIIVLITSVKRSRVLPAGANGHKLVTEDVVDFLLPGEPTVQKKYCIVSFCTLDNVTDFKLDPAGRAKTQAALINVTKVLEPDGDCAGQPEMCLLVDNVQLLTPEEAAMCKTRHNEMLSFAALAGQITKKKQRDPWSPQMNPGSAKRCKALGRTPSGPPLQEYASNF